ncbi:unnamed protein product [Sympodiomycopsis kandeliae]
MVYTLICRIEVKPGCEQLMADKLREASAIYRKDAGTIDWFVAQNTENARVFSVVERFENVEAQTVTHCGNPYWKPFNETVTPWLAVPIDIQTVNEL